MNLFGQDEGWAAALAGLKHSAHPVMKKTLNHIDLVDELLSIQAQDDLVSLAWGDVNTGFIDDPVIAPCSAGLTTGIRVHETAKTAGVFGNTGFGKSTLLQILVCGYLSLDLPLTCIVPDQKGDMKYLIPYAADQGVPIEDMLYLSARQNRDENTLWCAPFEPTSPKADVIEHARVMSETIAFFLGILDETRTVILDAAIRVLQKLPKGEYPSFADIHAEMESRFPKDYARANYYGKGLHRMDRIRTELPSLYYCRKGIPFSEYARCHLVIPDLTRCDQATTRLLLGILMTQVYTYCRHEVAFETPLRFALFIDEAETVLGQDRVQNYAGTGIQDELIRRGRTYGLHLIYANQTYTTLNRTARTVIGTMIAMSVNPAEVPAISQAMGLTPEQAALLASLPPQEAMIKFFGRPLPAFHIRVPHFTLEAYRRV